MCSEQFFLFLLATKVLYIITKNDHSFLQFSLLYNYIIELLLCKCRVSWQSMV